MLLVAHINTQHQITQWLVNNEMKEMEGSIMAKCDELQQHFPQSTGKP